MNLSICYIKNLEFCQSVMEKSISSTGLGGEKLQTSSESHENKLVLSIGYEKNQHFMKRSFKNHKFWQPVVKKKL